MVEQQKILTQKDTDQRRWLGRLAIGRDAHRYIFDKEAICMDAIDEQRLVDLGKLIEEFVLGAGKVQRKGA